MRAEIMAIGDELTTGQRLDTNSQWLAERLCECGVTTAFHTTVGDQLADHVGALRTAIERADIVLSSGGLGPTADDLTRQAMADATGTRLLRDEGSLEAIRRLFAQRGRTMPERNALQADFPTGAVPIPNQHGTAPGIDMTAVRAAGSACRLFALPGVPAEMFAMWREYVGPAILKLAPTQRLIRHYRLKCFGVGESQLEAMLPDLIRRGRDPSVGITVSDATITLRVTAAGADDAQCLVAMQPTLDLIRSTLGDLVFGEEDDELHHAALRVLRTRGKNVSVAEWGTGGLIGEWLAAADPGGGTFRGGMLAAEKGAVGKWAPEVAQGSAAPHEVQAAEGLARAARNLFGSDYGLGVSAFPPVPDAPDAHWTLALAADGEMRRARFSSAAHPAIRQARAAKQALDALRRWANQ